MTMTKAKSIGVIRTSAGTALLLLLLGLPPRALAADDRRLDAIKGTLQSSSLSNAEQTDVRARADAAIRGGVPAEDVEIIVSRAVQRGAGAEAINRFIDTSLSAKKEGVPIAPVLDRIEQGLSKGVPFERIAAASQQLAEKLAIAQPIVDTLIRGGVKQGRSSEREAAIAATARAIEKSIPVEDLKGMGAAVRDRKGTLPLFTSAANTAAYLAGSGMSVKTSSHLVRNAVEKGYSERDLDGMIKQMTEEMRHGSRPEDAATRMERGNMQGGRGMDQNMGNGRGPEAGSGGMGGMGGMGGRRK